jgi:hypothetical protein
MKALALSMLVGFVACSSTVAAEPSRDDVFCTGEYRLDGYWLLSGKWMGTMGVALKIDGNRFQYWFYSDEHFPDDPKYPLSGKVEVKKNVVHLKVRQPLHVYSDKWHLVIYKNQICLLADAHYQDYLKTDKLDDSRLLYKVKDEDILDKTKPQMNAPFRVDGGKVIGISGGQPSKGPEGK